MKNLLSLFTHIGDKASSLGALVSIMGCAMCFPAIASFGGALGLGFLSQWEGLFVNTLLPVFALAAFIINAIAWFNHHQWHRSILGTIGPVFLLLSLYPWYRYAWSSNITYSSLAWMILVSIWDLFSPANPHCEIEVTTAS